MKKITIPLIILLYFLSSCSKKKPEINYNWTGQEEIRHLVPTCIVWYKQVAPPIDAWRPYKAFSQANANDMRNIILLLTKPEDKDPNPNLNAKDKLSLIFYNGIPEELTVREVYFEIQNQTFIGPTGKSEKLAKILLEKEEVWTRFYQPYKNLDPTHYNNSWERVLKTQENLQKQGEQLKTQKEARVQQRTEDSNQAKP